MRNSRWMDRFGKRCRIFRWGMVGTILAMLPLPLHAQEEPLSAAAPTAEANSTELSTPARPVPVADPPSPTASDGDPISRPEGKRKKKAPADKTKYASAEEEVKAKLNRKGSITLRDATLNQAIFYIRQQWDIGIVFGNELQGDVNAVFADQPLYEILDTLLYARGYGYRTVGNSLVIMKREDIKGMDPRFETVTIPIQFGEVGEIETTVSQFGLLSPNGKMIPVPSAKAIMVMDYPTQINKAKEFIATLEDRFRKVAEDKKQLELTETKNQAATGEPKANSLETLSAPVPEMEYGTFRINHIKPKDLEGAIAQILSPEGKQTSIESESRIFIADYPERLRKIQQVIDQLDVARPQVRIWAMIYDASLDDVKRIGINWHDTVKGTGKTALGTPQNQIAIGSTTNSPPSGGSNGALTVMSLNTNFDVTAVVNALNTSKNSRLLANPNVIVMDKEKAKMAIVTEIPYQQLTQGGNSGGPIGTTAFREAGVSLEVTPSIADNGWIHMQVKPTFSLLTGFTQQSNQPIIDKRETETTVWVPTGETFVIGGLRQRQANHEGTGIPILQDLRFGFGYLFRSRQTTIRESELLVFLTPEMITPQSRMNPPEAVAYDYGRWTLGRIPSPACPPFGMDYPGGVPRRAFPAPGYAPEPARPNPDVAPIPDAAPVPGSADGAESTGDGSPPPVLMDESARLGRPGMPAHGRNGIMVRRVPPLEHSQPQYDQPLPPNVSPQQPAFPPDAYPPADPTVIAPAAANIPTGKRAEGATSARREPPKTLWEAIKRR